MPPLKHTQLFDFPAYAQAIKDVKAATVEFGTSVSAVISRIQKDQKGLVATLKEYADILKGFNVTSGGAADGLKSYNSQINATVGNLNELKAIQAGLASVVNLSTASVRELEAEMKGLVAQQKALKPGTAGYEQDMARINDRMKQVIPTVKAYSDSLKKTKSTIDAAEGSYKALANQLTQLKNKLMAMPGAFDAATGKINKNNKEAVALQKEITKLDTAVKQMDKSMGVFSRNVGNYGGALTNFRNSIGSLALSFVSLTALISGFGKMLDVAMKFESLNISIQAVTASTEDYQIAQNFLSLTADKYGQDIVTLSQAYKGLAAATKGTNLEGAQTRKVFESVVQAGSALKLSNDQLQGALLAIQQMFSKGTVSAEELRGQLGERLPGAFRLFAESMGVSEKELGKLLQKGEVLAKDTLPKFAEKLSEVYGDAAIANASSLVNETNRLNNAFQRFLVSFSETTGITRFWGAMKSGLSVFLEDLTYALDKGTFKAFKDFFTPDSEGKSKITVQREREAKTQQDNITFLSNFEKKSTEDRTKAIANAELALSQKRQQQAKNNAEIIERLEKGLTVITQREEQNKLLARIKGNEFFLAEMKRINERVVTTDPANQPQGVDDKAQKAAEARIRSEQRLLDKMNKLNQLALEERLVKGEIFEEQFQMEKLSLTSEYAAKAIELEKSLGKNADLDKIEAFKGVLKDQEIEFAKYLKRQDEIQRERSRFKGQIDTNTAKPANAFSPGGGVIAGLDKNMQKEIDAENRSFELLRARRDATFKDEQEHLEKIKNIRIKYKKDTTEQEAQIAELAAQREKEIRQELAEVSMQIAQEGLNLILNSLNANIEARISSLEAEKDRELALAGNNTAAREKIEADFNKKIRAEKVKQAKNEKAFAAFQIGINTAQAIARVLAEVPKFDFGISTAALIAAYSVLGAIQLAAVLSRPLPAFKKGTGHAPRGHALVGEEGFEIIEHQGKKKVTPGKPSITYLKGGERIYTHAQSKRMLEESIRSQEMKQLAETAFLHEALSSRLRAGKQAETVQALSQAFRQNPANIEKAFEKAVKGIPVHIHQWDERGYKRSIQEDNQRTTYLNDRHSLS